MELNLANIIYVSNINAIGGIETFVFNLAQQFKDILDLTVIYKNGDANQLSRLQNIIRIIRWQPDMHIICKKAFFNYDTDIIDRIDAEDYIQIIHGDYKALGITPNKPAQITKVVGVSQLVCDSYTELTGIPCELFYNPVQVNKTLKKPLRLISATRLTKEKGKQRIEKMSKLLDAAGIPYIWNIFTNDTQVIDSPNIAWHKPTLDISGHIAESDYLVQLSDTESYGYSIVESLSLGTPVIVTDMPICAELGIIHKKNAFIVDFNLDNFNPQEVYDTKLKFKYEAPTSDWSKLFYKSKPTYNKDLEAMYLVEALPIYKRKKIRDTILNRIPEPGEKFIVDYNRLLTLTGVNNLNTPFVKLIGQLTN